MKEEMKKLNFKNETEEAEWWEKNQDALASKFEEAAAAGTLGHGTAARKGNTPTTTIRLDPTDIAMARLQAEAVGLRYQTYLKMLIRQALQQQEVQAAQRGWSQENHTAGEQRLYVERRAQGDYAVRKPKSQRASAVLPTQAKAIRKAKQMNSNSSVLVERVRNASGGLPDKWRKP